MKKKYRLAVVGRWSGKSVRNFWWNEYLKLFGPEPLAGIPSRGAAHSSQFIRKADAKPKNDPS